MWAIFLRTIKDRRMSILSYLIIAISLAWMLVAMWPSLSEQSANYSELIENYPEEFLRAFGIDKNSVFDTLESFVAVENYSLMWPLLLIVLTISYGTSTIAGEIEKGTIEILLSLPVSRSVLYLSKYVAGLTLVILFTLISISAVPFFAWIYNIECSWEGQMALVGLGGLLGSALLGLSMMVSSYFSERGKASAVVAGIVIVMYILNLLATLQDQYESLKYLSFFYYYDYNSALNEHSISYEALWVFGGFSIAFALVGWWWFQKRDVSV